jgi:hypothetical protein
MRRELVTIGSMGLTDRQVWDGSLRRTPARSPVRWMQRSRFRLPMGAMGAAAQADINAAAIAMNSALAAHGYKQVDMPLYKNFQAAAGLGVDGYPGSDTMYQLQTVLDPLGVTPAPVKLYPWRATGGYDGINAPSSAEWYGAAPAPRPAPAPLRASVMGGSSTTALLIAALAAAGFVGYREFKKHRARHANPCRRMVRA